MGKEITKYNLEYKGVKCTGVNWEDDVFYLTLAGKEYTYKSEKWISCSADTDHIRYVINDFIEKIKEQLFQEFVNKGEGKND